MVATRTNPHDQQRLASGLMLPEKNEEVIGYADTLQRVNGEPVRGKVTRVAERSNEGLTKSA